MRASEAKTAAAAAAAMRATDKHLDTPLGPCEDSENRISKISHKCVYVCVCIGSDAAIDTRRLMRACVCVCGVRVLELTRR